MLVLLSHAIYSQKMITYTHCINVRLVGTILALNYLRYIKVTYFKARIFLNGSYIFPHGEFCGSIILSVRLPMGVDFG